MHSVQNELVQCPKWGNPLAGPANAGEKSGKLETGECIPVFTDFPVLSKNLHTAVQNEGDWCPKWITETDKTDWAKSKTPMWPILSHQSYKSHENAMQSRCPK